MNGNQFLKHCKTYVVPFKNVMYLLTYVWNKVDCSTSVFLHTFWRFCTAHRSKMKSQLEQWQFLHAIWHVESPDCTNLRPDTFGVLIASENQCKTTCLIRWLQHWPLVTIMSLWHWLMVEATYRLASKLSPENRQINRWKIDKQAGKVKKMHLHLPKKSIEQFDDCAEQISFQF